MKRLSQADYLPTTGEVPILTRDSRAYCVFSADVLNVRLQTLGVAEHSFDVELCGSRYNWLMYDVGGAVSIGFMYRGF